MVPENRYIIGKVLYRVTLHYFYTFYDVKEGKKH